MLMRIFRRAIFYFILVLAVMLLQAYSMGVGPIEALTGGYFYIIPTGVILAGLLLGLFSYLFIQYSKRIKSFFLFGLNMGFLLFILLLVFLWIQNWRAHRRYGYGSPGWSILKDADERGFRYVATGFECLQSKVTSPRNLHLKSYVTRKRDTLIGNAKCTIHDIFYTYSFKGDKTRYFSKVSVLNDKPVLSILNALTDTSREYNPMKYERSAELKAAEDSLRPLVGDDFIEFLESCY